MGKKYKCENIGCEEEFKCRIQVIRHAIKCNKPNGNGNVSIAINEILESVLCRWGQCFLPLFLF